VTEGLLAVDPLAVDVGTVQAAEIAEQEAGGPPLDHAVLLRHDLVEELDRVARVPAERIVIAQLYDLLALRSRKQDARHPGPQRTVRRPAQQGWIRRRARGRPDPLVFWYPL
jgi:hypothetical protein